MMQQFTEGRIKANGLEFYFIEAGTKGDPLVLCMHGFPDTNRTWRFLLPELAHAGFYAVAPNLRGYWPTELAKDNCYQTAALSSDVLNLITALGYGEAFLVGHDWGADAVLGAAQIAPKQVKKIIAMAEYYGTIATQLAETDPDEIARSYYMREFLQQDAVEKFKKTDFAYLRKLWRDWSPHYHCPPDEKEHIINTFRQKGVTEAALAYDKAALQKSSPHCNQEFSLLQELMDTRQINTPTLLLYGEYDGCHGKEIIEAMPQELLPHCMKKMIKGAGHFLHLEVPEAVNNCIINFICRD